MGAVEQLAMMAGQVLQEAVGHQDQLEPQELLAQQAEQVLQVEMEMMVELELLVFLEGTAKLDQLEWEDLLV